MRLCCPPHLMCVPTLPWRKWIVKFPRVQQLILVSFPQNFFVLKHNFDIFCRNTPEENIKNTCCSLASYLLLSSSALQQTTQTDAIKAVIHTVKMRFRKLRKNNVRNTKKPKQLKQEVLELCTMGTNAGVQHRNRKQKKFCGNKTSTGCKTRGNLTTHFCQGNVGTQIRRGGQYTSGIVQKLFRCHYAKNYRNRLIFD